MNKKIKLDEEEYTQDSDTIKNAHEFKELSNTLRKKNNELYKLENDIINIKNEIDLLNKKRYKVCNHKWEICVVYGERTTYDCLNCGCNSLYNR